MGQRLRTRAHRLARCGASAALLLAFGIGTASATTDEEAASACEQALLAEGATYVREVEVRREDRVPYMHGVADFGGSEGVRVRCRVYNGQVSSLRYLVRNPTVRDGWLWTAEPPASAAQADQRPGETAGRAVPPQDGAEGEPDETAELPESQEPVEPLWRNAGETDFGTGPAATEPPPDKPVVLRGQSVRKTVPAPGGTVGAPPPDVAAGAPATDEAAGAPPPDETAGAPPPEASAGTASSEKTGSPLFLRPPG